MADSLGSKLNAWARLAWVSLAGLALGTRWATVYTSPEPSVKTLPGDGLPPGIRELVEPYIEDFARLGFEEFGQATVLCRVKTPYVVFLRNRETATIASLTLYRPRLNDGYKAVQLETWFSGPLLLRTSDIRPPRCVIAPWVQWLHAPGRSPAEMCEAHEGRIGPARREHGDPMVPTTMDEFVEMTNAELQMWIDWMLKTRMMAVRGASG